jgi:hypothetical protein
MTLIQFLFSSNVVTNQEGGDDRKNFSSASPISFILYFSDRNFIRKEIGFKYNYSRINVEISLTEENVICISLTTFGLSCLYLVLFHFYECYRDKTNFVIKLCRYRGSPVSAVFGSPANRTIGKIALIGD